MTSSSFFRLVWQKVRLCLCCFRSTRVTLPSNHTTKFNTTTVGTNHEVHDKSDDVDPWKVHESECTVSRGLEGIRRRWNRNVPRGRSWSTDDAKRATKPAKTLTLMQPRLRLRHLVTSLSLSLWLCSRFRRPSSLPRENKGGFLVLLEFATPLSSCHSSCAASHGWHGTALFRLVWASPLLCSCMYCVILVLRE